MKLLKKERGQLPPHLSAGRDVYAGRNCYKYLGCLKDTNILCVMTPVMGIHVFFAVILDKDWYTVNERSVVCFASEEVKRIITGRDGIMYYYDLKDKRFERRGGMGVSSVLPVLDMDFDLMCKVKEESCGFYK